jgi:predicted transcriptional regulator
VNIGEVNPYLTVKIVRSYVQHHTLGPDQLSDLINSVHRAIGQLGQPPELEEIRTPAVSVRRSVHQDYVICLDCGYRAKTLRRHIRTRHGLGRDEYLRRWGLRSDHPLTAPAYSERRSTLAKSLGLGRKAPIEAARPETPTAAPAPTASITGNSKAKRTRKSRPPRKSESAASETVAVSTPARRRGSHARVASPSG